MNKLNKNGFTFVEMIISISIVVLLAVIWKGYLDSGAEKNKSAKVWTDLTMLENSLLAYSLENNSLPKAWWNDNYFNEDTSYAHSFSGAFGAHWFITEDTLPKKYTNYLPLDPVTNPYNLKLLELCLIEVSHYL